MQIAAKHDASYAENIIVVADDSHGVGGFGANGRGTEEVVGAKVDVLIGTLGKAFGVNGGYVVAAKPLIAYLRETSPFYIYSNPITPGEAEAARVAVERVDSQEGRGLLDHLRAMTQRFRDGLRTLGLETVEGQHPVVPLLVRDTAPHRRARCAPARQRHPCHRPRLSRRAEGGGGNSLPDFRRPHGGRHRRGAGGVGAVSRQGGRRMKFKDATRYEFRRFGEDFAVIRDRFAALGPGKKQHSSRETYIVTRLNIESNVKIRAGRLQVKTLRGRLQALEEWARPLDADFPVSVEEIESIVIPALGLDLEIGRGGALTEGALLSVIAGQPALATTKVDKQRTLYDLGNCIAEYCELRIGDDKLDTIAIETLDAEAAFAVLNKVGLGEAQNESYAEFLQRRLF